MDLGKFVFTSMNATGIRAVLTHVDDFLYKKKENWGKIMKQTQYRMRVCTKSGGEYIKN